MGLTKRRFLDSVDPWLARVVSWIDDEVQAAYGGVHVNWLSAYRTPSEQETLWRKGVTPAAPFCSQHQWGYAGDVEWTRLHFGGTRPDLLLESPQKYAETLQDIAGLSRVRGDRFHFAVFPGYEFRNWARSWGFDCRAASEVFGSGLIGTGGGGQGVSRRASGQAWDEPICWTFPWLPECAE